jgi:CHAD domain-containing protein
VPVSAGKWVDDLTAATPLADAALRVLDVRLAVVRDYLGLALHEYATDPEHVHQLRVGTRRAGAALDIFAVCLPDKVYRKARKRLRSVRRAAGAARDWDVFLLDLSARNQKGAGRQRAGLDFLVGYALGQREAAQDALRASEPDYPFAFERLLARVLHVVRPAGGPYATLLDLARPVLGRLLGELDQAAARDLNDYGNLHQVRIAGKRLRYAMEVFAGCFPPVFRDVHYATVEEMQEVLGRANDSHVAVLRLGGLCDRLAAMLPEAWKRYRPKLKELLQAHEARLAEERRGFEAWWHKWRQGGGEAGLSALLTGAGAAVAR